MDTKEKLQKVFLSRFKATWLVIDLVYDEKLRGLQEQA